jgi:hypothetical protein
MSESEAHSSSTFSLISSIPEGLKKLTNNPNSELIMTMLNIFL